MLSTDRINWSVITLSGPLEAEYDLVTSTSIPYLLEHLKLTKTLYKPLLHTL
jgi:hypothetical protein